MIRNIQPENKRKYNGEIRERAKHIYRVNRKKIYDLFDEKNEQNKRCV